MDYTYLSTSALEEKEVYWVEKPILAAFEERSRTCWQGDLTLASMNQRQVAPGRDQSLDI